MRVRDTVRTPASLGGGVVNRKVLENCNIDPDEYSGFAAVNL